MPLITIYLDENGRNSIESVMATVVRGAGCWTWPLPGQKGAYKAVSIGGKKHHLHRLMYQQMVGEIPKGYEVDHLCRNPWCCNPAHLEAVPKRVNILRGESMAAKWARRTHCEKGHPFDEENTIIRTHGGSQHRQCRACTKVSDRKKYENQQSGDGKKARVGMPHGSPTCQRGHLFDEQNTMTKPDGRRRCRACDRLRDRARSQRRKELA